MKIPYYKYIQALAFCSIIAILYGCQDRWIRIAETTDNTLRGISAINKIKNEDKLFEIASASNDSLIALAAVKRISNELFLASIAFMDSSSRAGRENACQYARQRISNSSVLKMISAGDSIPNFRRSWLLHYMLPAMEILMNPEVSNLIGVVDSVTFKWDSISMNYYFGQSTVTFNGERLTCVIDINNNIKLSQSWESAWPDTLTNTGWIPNFVPCEVDLGNFLLPVIKILPTEVLEELSIIDDHLIREKIELQLGWIDKYGNRLPYK